MAMLVQVNQGQLRAANKAFRRLPKDLKNDLRKWQRSEVGPIWKEEIATTRSAAPAMSQAAFKTGNRVKAGASIALVAGGSAKKLSGGATYSQLAKEAEFGSNRRNKYTKYHRRSTTGKSFSVTRRTGRQLPEYRRGGYVVYPASIPTIKRIASLNVQVTTRKIYDAMEGK